MNRNNPQSGFSLVELVVGVMIVGIAFVAAMYAHSQMQVRSTTVEATLRATSLANSIMEKAQSLEFDENTEPPWGSVLGPEESSVNDYDDVDDYAGYIWSVTGYDGYSAKTRVFYVNPSASWLDSTDVVTDYKRIVVSVQHGGLSSPIILSSLMTPHGE